MLKVYVLKVHVLVRVLPLACVFFEKTKTKKEDSNMQIFMEIRWVSECAYMLAAEGINGLYNQNLYFKQQN